MDETKTSKPYDPDGKIAQTVAEMELRVRAPIHPEDWCDHCSADLNGIRHILCENCYRTYVDSPSAFRYYVVFEIVGFHGSRYRFMTRAEPLETVEAIENLRQDIATEANAPDDSVVVTNWRRID